LPHRELDPLLFLSIPRDFVESWFMPFSATYRERRGIEPDNLFQMLSKHSGGDGRPFVVYRYVIETRKALAH
jgi:hypothetical protein